MKLNWKHVGGFIGVGLLFGIAETLSQFLFHDVEKGEAVAESKDDEQEKEES